jgi:hypothetical protein
MDGVAKTHEGIAYNGWRSKDSWRYCIQWMALQRLMKVLHTMDGVAKTHEGIAYNGWRSKDSWRYCIQWMA